MEELLGQVISGSFERILLRQKAGVHLEIGSLAIAELGNKKILLQVSDLTFGSQLSLQDLELVSGLELEQSAGLELEDKELRNYTIAVLKPLLLIDGREVTLCKTLPGFFSYVRNVRKEDLGFLTRPPLPLYAGILRSGSKTVDIPVYLDAPEVLSHHVLIPAQTGRGKSNLTMCLLLGNLSDPITGMLVMDPHDEYFGRIRPGLKDHPNRKSLAYYTSKMPPAQAHGLAVSLKLLKPSHFMGVMPWSEPQVEAMFASYRQFGEDWISNFILGSQLEQFHEGTLQVVRRRLVSILDIEAGGSGIVCSGIFKESAGESFVQDVLSRLENSETVVIDTSSLGESAEVLLGSMLSFEILSRYQHHKRTGDISRKPGISIVLEEAVRVLGKETLDKGPNVFSTIAREGRKFKVGLLAITQLPSLIPREILANMGTKIILGIEMQPERRAIIESAAQDLTSYDRAIASLDKGEALITSQFTKFPVPIRIPSYEKMLLDAQTAFPAPAKPSFQGIRLVK